jgi:hypothetical protein
MITVTYADKNISMKNLNNVLFNEDCIKQIARLMVASQVECFMDMSNDMPENEGPKTFKEAVDFLESAKQNLEEGYMADVLSDFRQMLYAAVKATTINIKTVSMSENGIEDVVAEIA